MITLSDSCRDNSLHFSQKHLKHVRTVHRTMHEFSAANDWNTLQKSLKLESTVPLITFKS